MEEIWKEYKYPYWVSNLGRVKNIESGNYLNGYTQNKGYQMIKLIKIEEKYQLLHRLVALTFIENDNPKEKTQVNHIDGEKLNNCVSNLEWVTPKENMHHSFKTGLQPKEMKTIYCFTLDGKFVGKYINAVEAANALNNPIAHSTIWKTVKSSHIAYDLWWTYSENFDRQKKIFVYDKQNNKLINSYFTQKDCCDDLNISTSHLSQCLKGTKNHSKYIFTKIE